MRVLKIIKNFRSIQNEKIFYNEVKKNKNSISLAEVELEVV